MHCSSVVCKVENAQLRRLYSFVWHIISNKIGREKANLFCKREQT